MPRVSLVVVCLAFAASACSSRPAPSLAPFPQSDTRATLHVLNRVAFGPRPGDLERVGAIGRENYIDQQLHPERIADEALNERLAALTALPISAHDFAVRYYLPMIAARDAFARRLKLDPKLEPITTPEETEFQRENQQVFTELQNQKLLRAVYSERQLQEVLTDFWFNHFNVDARKVEDRPVVVQYERDVIRPHVLGKFRDLLDATAKSPAMLFYLDNWLSSAPPPPPVAVPGRRLPAASAKPAAPARGLNENYARELMELHTLGVDGGYTQADVVAVARCFTGWTMKKPREATGFEFNDKMHDHGEKRVLGHRIKGGRGIEDGEEVLDILAGYPSTARFIATKLVRRFVADEPPPALVDRAAKTFRKTDGDLRAVMRTILLSPEFAAPPAYRAKIKTPLEFVASALRATGASITNPRAFVGSIASLGEPLYQYQAPTGYGDRASVWVNTGTLVGRLNFAQALIANGMNAAAVPWGKTDDSPDRLAALVLADDLSPQTRAAIDRPGATPAVRTALLVGSPEFQRR
jgi:uncharacterized protein (DUF1800 family)